MERGIGDSSALLKSPRDLPQERCCIIYRCPKSHLGFFFYSLLHWESTPDIFVQFRNLFTFYRSPLTRKPPQPSDTSWRFHTTNKCRAKGGETTCLCHPHSTNSRRRLRGGKCVYFQFTQFSLIPKMTMFQWALSPSHATRTFRVEITFLECSSASSRNNEILLGAAAAQLFIFALQIPGCARRVEAAKNYHQPVLKHRLPPSSPHWWNNFCHTQFYRWFRHYYHLMAAGLGRFILPFAQNESVRIVSRKDVFCESVEAQVPLEEV